MGYERFLKGFASSGDAYVIMSQSNSFLDMEQILFPWVKYSTNDLIIEYLNPYIYNGVVNVLDVSVTVIWVLLLLYKRSMFV